jgi:glycerol-3-phosphate dehydrogenase
MGVHLVFSADDIPCNKGVVMPTPNSSGAVFLIRWGKYVIAGTTDYFYEGKLQRPRATAKHVDLILRRLNAALPKAKLTRSHVLSSYAGLRPLIQDEKETLDSTKLSREDLLIGNAPGLVSITGGKLTTYRKMAQIVMDRVVDGLDMSGRDSVTDQLPLFSAPRSDNLQIRMYGTEANRIQELASGDSALANYMVDGEKNLMAEAIYALKYERAVRLADILSRRTRLAVFSWQATRKAALSIAEALEPYTGWNAQEEVQHFLHQSKEFQEVNPPL